MLRRGTSWFNQCGPHLRAGGSLPCESRPDRPISPKEDLGSAAGAWGPARLGSTQGLWTAKGIALGRSRAGRKKIPLRSRIDYNHPRPQPGSPVWPGSPWPAATSHPTPVASSAAPQSSSPGPSPRARRPKRRLRRTPRCAALVRAHPEARFAQVHPTSARRPRRGRCPKCCLRKPGVPRR